jgi:hypothetical protein
VPISIWIKWAAVIVSSGILGASIMMMAKGTLPPPMSKVRVPAAVSTAIFIVGMTGLLVFGEPELLKNTLAIFIGG